MTGMQLIVPPLEEQNEQGAREVEGTNRNEVERNNNQNEALSPELREHFEAMKSLWRQSRRSDNKEEEVEELKHKQREKAMETALAVEMETSRLRSGIAELEAMLARQEEVQDGEGDRIDEAGNDDGLLGHHNDHVGRDVLLFPFLPPVVPPEDGEDNTTVSGGSASETVTTTDPSSLD